MEAFVYGEMVKKMRKFHTLKGGKEQSYNPKLTAARVALAKTESEIEKLLDTLSGEMCIRDRSKYITFGLPAEGIAEARPRLERVEVDVTGNLKRLGVPSAPMDGQERLALLHSQMHPGSREPFRFSWQDIPRTGMGTKDFIAPDSFDFRQSRTCLLYTSRCV